MEAGLALHQQRETLIDLTISTGENCCYNYTRVSVLQEQITSGGNGVSFLE